MQTFLINNKHKINFNDTMRHGIALLAVYLLNIAQNIERWWAHIGPVVKVSYAIIVGVGTILYGFNQWYIFKKNNRTMWIVVRIDNVMKYFVEKKNRRKNRRLNFRKNKTDTKQ